MDAMCASRWLCGLLLMLTPLVTTAQSGQTDRQGAGKTGWQYQQTVEPSTGTTDKATLEATNLLQLAYPYAGGSVVTLTIRHRAGSTTAYLSVSKGLLAPSFQGGTVRVRFNSGKPATFSLSAAANGRGNLVFFDDPQRFIKQVRAAKTMTLQLQMPGQQLNEISFNAAGLRWTH